jgi:hypothetical protein
MKLPCHLESSEEGRDFYLKHRFKEYGMKEFDLSGYDMEGQEMSKLTEMVRKLRGIAGAFDANCDSEC